MTQPPHDGTGEKGAASRYRQAEQYVKDPEKTRRLIDEAFKKAQHHKAQDGQGPLAQVWDSLGALMRLVRAWANGTYRQVPWSSIVWVVSALIYFVSPIDLVPDFIPVAGLLDDAAVLAWVVGRIKADLDVFLAWEKQQGADPSAGEGETQA